MLSLSCPADILSETYIKLTLECEVAVYLLNIFLEITAEILSLDCDAENEEEGDGLKERERGNTNNDSYQYSFEQRESDLLEFWWQCVSSLTSHFAHFFTNEVGEEAYCYVPVNVLAQYVEMITLVAPLLKPLDKGTY
jgi:hypothetical protein